MHEFHICIPVEMSGTRGARFLESIADNRGSRVVRCAPKTKHTAFRQSRVDALAARLERTLDECAVVIRALMGSETREFGFTYRAVGLNVPSSLEEFRVRPLEPENDASPFEKVLLDASRDMISRGYLTRQGRLRASVLIVHATGWSSAFCLEGSLETVVLAEISTIHSRSE